ncbi:WXG100 family type VII secretion target [Microbacterium sp. W4I4]|uniref:WXG100 family type VII secretion target n=1 Tax=Microbacterium sp. W4I4 TaxID=3042295 RepID=UPI00278AD3B9|nr:WXG100 family type VII secretion target [Microbacterium sp. W4I4]MDQ0614172.1 WXG100 family type VII secretion target [Microbacterium sp. W4I4]
MTVVGEISAADGALQRGAKIVGESKIEIVTELNAIANKLSGINASWTGGGSDAFQKTFAAWGEKSRRITNALDEFQQNLLDSQTTYSQTDDTSRAAQTKLMGRLG